MPVQFPQCGTFKMAFILFTSFAIPLRPSPMLSLNKGVHQLGLSLDRLSSKATTSTAQMVTGSCSSSKHILSKKNCQHWSMSCTRNVRETCSCNLDVDYCTEIVISGYWVGPDPDDGWGVCGSCNQSYDMVLFVLDKDKDNFSLFKKREDLSGSVAFGKLTTLSILQRLHKLTRM